MKSHQVQRSKQGVQFVFKCKANSVPKVTKSKVLRGNIPVEQDINIGFHTRRPPILIMGMMMPKSHIWRGKKSNCREKSREGRWVEVGQGCRPLRFGDTHEINSTWYSRSPEQYDLLMQIWGLKRPPMAKYWIPKLWPILRASIWTYGKPNLDQETRRYSPWNTCCAHKFEIRQIMFRGYFVDLIFISKENQWIPKLEIISWHTIYTPNLHCLDSRRGRYGVGKGRTAKQETLDEADFMETKFASLPSKISCKVRWSMPQGYPRV
jgi:hypothetical protein